MTFPRKGTRHLTVTGRGFHWHVSPKHVDLGGNLSAVQLAAVPGRLLFFWCRDPDGFPSPREASECITFALAHGWDPASHGRPLWVGCNADGLYLSDRRVAAP
jgi:hypothetical protein